jgi:uncharacterized membrane protein YbaN (DUF454 family)
MVKRNLLIAAGLISLSLGAIGIFVPLLPTTPFLLLASACFVRSSEKLHNWLIHHKVFGHYIRCYQQFRAISLRLKIMTVTVLWVFIGYAVVFAVNAVWIRLILLIIAVAVTIHILRLRTLTNEMLADVT